MRPLTIAHTSPDQHHRSATSSEPSALCGGGHHEPVRRRHSLSRDLLPPSRGRGRRLPVARVLRHWLRQRSVTALPRAIFHPLPGGSPMGAAPSMFHASPLGAHYLLANLFVVCLCLCPCCASLPHCPSGQLRVARRCRTLPRASSRRSDW